MDIEDAMHEPHGTMQQHLHQKLGRPADLGQKTPLRTGLGLMVNESKTPGAKSLQGLASARKVPPSTVKKTIPCDEEYEVFQDEPEEEMPPVRKIEEKPSAVDTANPELTEQEALAVLGVKEWDEYPPIDTANRCQSFDSLAADIADDMLNWKDRSVELTDEPVADNCEDLAEPEMTEQEALASLGVEEWDEYPPIEIASRIADDHNYPITLEELHYEDVILEESEDYLKMIEEAEPFVYDRELMKKIVKDLEDELEDVSIYDLIDEQNAVIEALLS